jgi:cytochrome c-type biogenesis protein CcmE
MKKMHILAIVAILAGISIIVIGSKDVSTYSSFTAAMKTDQSVKITGTLDKDKDMNYDPEVNPNLFTFHMKDGDGLSKKVLLNRPKPQDFERAESIVVTGKMVDGDFAASEILMKCPSKYKDEEIRIRAEI